MSATFQIKTGRTHLFVTRLERLHLEAFDDQGQPLGGWHYLVVSGEVERRGQLDEQGCADVPAVPSGTCKVHITEEPIAPLNIDAAPTLALLSSPPIPDAAEDEAVRLRRAALPDVLAAWRFDPRPVSLSLRVVGDNLEPLRDAKLAFGDGLYHATTDGDGCAHFPAVVPASYVVDVEHAEAGATRADVVVTRDIEPPLFAAGQGQQQQDGSGRTIPLAGRTAELVVQVVTHFTLRSSRKMRWDGGNVLCGVQLLDGNRNQVLITITDCKTGLAQLNLSGVADGSYILRVFPDAEQHTQSPAPFVDHPLSGKMPSRMYRPLEATVHITDKKVGTPPPEVTTGNHGNIFQDSPRKLLIDWKPDWIASQGFGDRDRKDIFPHIIVLHRPGEQSPDNHSEAGLGGTLTKFSAPKPGPSAHFVVDVDGHVVQMVRIDKASNHIDEAFWDGPGVRKKSIGIEIVNKIHQGYPDAQKTAVLKLVQSLCHRFEIKPSMVVGHGDVNVYGKDDKYGKNGEIVKKGRPTEPLMLDYERHYDPGLEFFWKDLAIAGNALNPWGATLSPSVENDMYGGLFSNAAFPVLVNGATNDALLEKSGQVRAGSTPISELQQDLRTIGYSIHGDGSTVTGTYSESTHMAVLHFQNHFFAGAWSLEYEQKHAGRFDRETALMLKRCVQAFTNGSCP
jgi:N-acetyl-anhydromuramyl-L-alanine amidase AmpD